MPAFKRGIPCPGTAYPRSRVVAYPSNQYISFWNNLYDPPCLETNCVSRALCTPDALRQVCGVMLDGSANTLNGFASRSVYAPSGMD